MSAIYTVSKTYKFVYRYDIITKCRFNVMQISKQLPINVLMDFVNIIIR